MHTQNLRINNLTFSLSLEPLATPVRVPILLFLGLHRPSPSSSQTVTLNLKRRHLPLHLNTYLVVLMIDLILCTTSS